MWNNNYSQSGFRGNNYRQNYNNGGYQNQNFNQRPVKKHSGAKFGYAHGDQEKPYVTGWNYSRSRGLISIICSPYKGKDSQTKRVKSKNGREWENWKAKVTIKKTMQIQWFNCLYDVANKKVIINDIGMMIKPSSPNGGYCGKFTKGK